jgi:hypothetical protein
VICHPLRRNPPSFIRRTGHIVLRRSQLTVQANVCA